MGATIKQGEQIRAIFHLTQVRGSVVTGVAGSSLWLLSVHGLGQPPHPARAPAAPLTLRSTPLRGGGAESTPVGATLPNGRRVTPLGEWIKVAPYPFALAMRPDDGEVVLPSIGWPFSLNVVPAPGAGASVLQKTPVRQLPAGRRNDPNVQVMTGVAYSPDGNFCTTQPATRGR